MIQVISIEDSVADFIINDTISIQKTTVVAVKEATRVILEDKSTLQKYDLNTTLLVTPVLGTVDAIFDWISDALDSAVGGGSVTVTNFPAVQDVNLASQDIPISVQDYRPYKSDAFGRDRVSNTFQRLDVEFLYDKQPEYFDEVTNGGSASVTFNTNTRDLTMLVGSTTPGEFSSMSSYPVPYTPGNSQLVDITAVLDFANIGGGNCELFLRSSKSGTAQDLVVVDESAWDIDTSGIDWSKSHIFQMDFQSLKVGTIRFFMVRNGVPTQVSQINNDNLYDSGYWQIPNLPVYFKIYNDGANTYMEVGYGDDNNAIGFRYKIAVNATATMKAICCTVKSEGGQAIHDINGLPFSVDTGTATKAVSTTLIPIISIRSNTTFLTLHNHILISPLSIFVQSDESIRYAIVHEGVLTGASWSDVDANRSSAEVDVSATAISGGHVIYSDYLYASSAGGKGSIDVGSGIKEGILGKTFLWDRLGAEPGTLTIVAEINGLENAAVQAGIRWQEIR